MDGTRVEQVGRNGAGREGGGDRAGSAVARRWQGPCTPSGGRGSGGLLAHLADEEGSATAEYAIATMAAVGFAGLLVVILKGDEVRGILTDLVTRALTSGG
ncbi:DUF4244 domain-containing protein [Rathayibacter sp. VKM Ac-2803]|uniref:DUF4244 domain-containing protein n=1 Tax=unclassified Rathayibacter TaxID=2609250 RepID=UPI001357ADE2|nr:MULTISPECIES: DUF4244 domain-containing protein [unclassified Rathayibacter]MWV49234.1 DUF4244 domain-containing protein [Rathayibacter sp. VKM Ac-2803]MWV60016.1 DUF4244 domain-containing protein [Rathayibacter sp. VKM Ac-2754]